MYQLCTCLEILNNILRGSHKIFDERMFNHSREYTHIYFFTRSHTLSHTREIFSSPFCLFKEILSLVFLFVFFSFRGYFFARFSFIGMFCVWSLTMIATSDRSHKDTLHIYIYLYTLLCI
ncbi:hypothetical protein PUN28_003860 [Cardiocondyla obscurior]|uniref:Uncharacterized protein n=1 Tax=Cardiocondyla obscurior TaxID=286306 RepID=A0AAW2GN81_9HYME